MRVHAHQEPLPSVLLASVRSEVSCKSPSHRPPHTQSGAPQGRRREEPQSPPHRACAEPSPAAPCRRSRRRPTVAVRPIGRQRPRVTAEPTAGRSPPPSPFAALLSPLLRGPPQRKSRGSAPAGSQSELRTFVPPPTPRPLSALRGTNARADWLRRTLLAVRPPRAKKTTVAQRPKKPEGRRRAGRRPTAARYPYGQRPRESEVAARPGPPNGEAKQPRASRPSLPHGGSRPPPLVVILVTSGAP